MKALLGTVVVLFALSCSGAALAGGCGDEKAAAGCGAKATACGDKCKGSAKDGSAKGGCAGEKLAAAGMPKMTYIVGDEKTCCPEQAQKLADKNADAKIQYVLGDKTYADRTEALTAYEAALTAYLETVTTVRYAVGDQCVACPDAAAKLAAGHKQAVKYRVASFTFTDKAKAEEAAKAAKTAADQVKLAMATDGKAEGKPCSAGEKKACAGAEAQGCGAKATAKADGDAKSCHGDKAAGTVAQAEKKGCCPVSEKVDLVKARIEAAYTAVEKLSGTDVAGA
jgi:hypothetical protein